MVPYKNTGSTILRALRAYDSQIFRVMQRKLMNNKEVFGTPISVILAVHITIMQTIPHPRKSVLAQDIHWLSIL
jgi:hypothetical protein